MSLAIGIRTCSSADVGSWAASAREPSARYPVRFLVAARTVHVPIQLLLAFPSNTNS